MTDFFSNLFLIVLGTFTGGLLASIAIIYQIKKNFFKPKLYFKNVKITPTKGDITKDKFMWGGLIFTGELHNDSDYWAYNIRIKDLYAEFRPNMRVKVVDKTPLRLATDLPRIDNFKYFQANSQQQNIKPGNKINTTIRIISKKEISLNDYKQLIKELKLIRLRTRVIYENSSGHTTSTYFWLDFQHARFINFFSKGLTNTNFLKNWHKESSGKIKVKSKIIEIETEPF